MEIGGICYIPKNVEWIVKFIEKSFSQAPENFIEIWNQGNVIIFHVFKTGMKFELYIRKKSVLVWGVLESQKIFIIDQKRYPLTKKGLEKSFKEIIDLMKIEMNKRFDSILKVKK